MSAALTTLASPATRRPRDSAQDPRWVRCLLITLTFGFLTLFIILPAVNVFVQAFSNGVKGYREALFYPKPASPAPTLGQVKRQIRDDPDHEESIQAAAQNLREQWTAYTRAEKNRTAIGLTLMVVVVTVPLNVLFGLAAAWAIARFRFPGRSLLITLIDLPFSISPVVAGLIFVLIFGAHGLLLGFSHSSGITSLDPTNWAMPDLRSLYWRGFSDSLWPIGAHDTWRGVIFTPIAVFLATAFITFPFVARTLIPVMMTNGSEEELAALSLGASPLQMFTRITIPNAKWGLFYGLILCTARTCGEFGAVSVVSGRRDSVQTMPLRIEALWQSPGGTPAAFTLASLLTLLALVTLALKAFIEWRSTRVAQTLTVRA